jgi:hypothetical protein
MVLNPSSSSSSNGNGSSRCNPGDGACASAAAAVELTAEQYQHIAAVIIAQLQTLFGVAPAGIDDSSSSSSSSDGVQSGTSVRVQWLPAGRSGFSAWQVDALLRQRSAADVREASRVLAALSTLVLELPNLEMPDLIGEQVGGRRAMVMYVVEVTLVCCS